MSSMNVKTQPRTISQRDLFLMGTFLLPVVVFWPTAVSMFEVWMRSNTFAHGIIVFPLAVYLLFERRGNVSEVDASPSFAGLVLMVLLSAAWYFAALAKASVAQQLSLGLMMSAGVLMVFGAGVASRLAFPLLYVLFAVPVGEFLVKPLMTWTAEFTVFALQVTGIPVFKEGMFFRIPSGNFEVAKACSGIRYLIASVSLGVLYANLFLKTRWRQILFVGISIAVPILANGLRAYGIVMIAHLSGMKLAVGIDHIIYGWVFFGIVMLLMFSFGWRLRASEDRQAEEGERARPVTLSESMPGTRTGRDGVKPRVAIVLALAIMLVPRLVVSLSSAQSFVTITAAAPLPVAQQDWRGPFIPRSEIWTPEFARAASSGLADYSSDLHTVTLFLATYDARNRGSEMVSWENSVFSEPWKAINTSMRQVAADGQHWKVSESLIDRHGQRKLLWSWFETDSIRSGAEFMGKIAETLAALPLRRETPRVIVLATDAGDDIERDRRLLQSFLEQTYAGLRECIDDARSEIQDGPALRSNVAQCQTVASR